MPILLWSVVATHDSQRARDGRGTSRVRTSGRGILRSAYSGVAMGSVPLLRRDRVELGALLDGIGVALVDVALLARDPLLVAVRRHGPHEGHHVRVAVAAQLGALS